MKKGAPPRPVPHQSKCYQTSPHSTLGSVMQLEKFPWSGYLHCLSGVFLDMKSINSNVPKSWVCQFISIKEICHIHIHQDCRPISEPQTHGQCPQRWLYAWSKILPCRRSPSSEYFDHLYHFVIPYKMYIFTQKTCPLSTGCAEISHNETRLVIKNMIAKKNTSHHLV